MAAPVAVGKYWIQTDPSLPGSVALDVSEPSKPVEASRLVLGERFTKSRWIAADRNADRVVVTGNNLSWVLIADIDPATGKLTLDQKFKMKGSDTPGLTFDRPRWPHGPTGKAFVHGAPSSAPVRNTTGRECAPQSVGRINLPSPGSFKLASPP